MKFSEYDVVALIKDRPEDKLKKGDKGAIVMVHIQPNEAYEVEFVDDLGKTKALLTLLPYEIIKVK